MNMIYESGIWSIDFDNELTDRLLFHAITYMYIEEYRLKQIQLSEALCRHSKRAVLNAMYVCESIK